MPEEKKPEGTVSIPPDADEESKKIAEEIAEGKSEGEKPEEETPKEPDKGQEEPEKEKGEEAGGDKGKKKEKEKEDKPEEGGEEGKEEEGEERKPKRTPQTMPIYKHKIAEKKWEKDKEDLNTKIRDLESEVKKKASPDRSKVISGFAEKHGFETEMVEELLKIVESGQPDLRKELDDLRSEIEKGREERERTHQYGEFDKDYEKNIVPLLEKDGIPSEKRKEVRKLLRTLAFTTEYANTPNLSVIYRGDERFDEFKVKGKKSAEPSRGGARGGKESEPETGEDIMDQSDKDFEEFSDRKGREQSNLTIVRKGQRIG